MLTFLQRKITVELNLKPSLYYTILSSLASLQKGLVSILKCVYRALDSCDSGGLGGGLMLFQAQT